MWTFLLRVPAYKYIYEPILILEEIEGSLIILVKFQIGWMVRKNQCLSLLWCHTLSTILLSYIPYFHMQYAKLSRTLCNEIKTIHKGLMYLCVGIQTRLTNHVWFNYEICCLPKMDRCIVLTFYQFFWYYTPLSYSLYF